MTEPQLHLLDEPAPDDVFVFPASFAQRRLWFLEQLEPGSSAYNIAAAVHLSGRLDAEALARSLRETVRRHETLRTTFASQDGEPVQVIAPKLELELPVTDLRGRSGAARRLAAEEARRPFDLERGPLLRAALLRLDDEEHILLLTLHHIVADGWSMGVLVQETAALYGALVRGGESPLPELPIQYADYTLWQQDWLQGEALEEQLRYWRGALEGAPGLLELPTDRPRSARRGSQGAALPTRLAPALAAALQAYGRGEGATLFMTLLAGFHGLLGRFTGQEDAVVGSPVANRNRPELRDLIGFFVNTLALRLRSGGDPGFRELLRRARAATAGAYAHQDVPFERLVEELAPERSLARTPLFQAMLALQNAPMPPLELAGLRLRVLPPESTAPQLDLVLELQETAEGIEGRWMYDPELFDATTVQRFDTAFQRLLAAALADPERPVADLPLLGAGERHQLLVEWNDTRVERPGVLLHELVLAQAERTPAAVAVDLEGEVLTYGEMALRARRLARELRRLGVGPDVVVGLHAERSFALVVGMLGILEAGGAWLPLDPGFPRERLAFFLEDAGAGLLLVQEALAAGLPERSARRILLDDQGNTRSGIERGDGAPGPRPDPDHLAYVLYTSGSTGRPKGVLVPHRAVANRLLWAQEVYALGPEDAVLQKASIGFDFSVWECFGPLLAGARLVLARPEGHRDPAYLARRITASGVTLVHFVPSLLGPFLDEPESRRCTSLRQVYSGGEALGAELRDRFLTGLGSLGVSLHNQYGPTETCIDSMYWACAPGQDPWRVPIGRPMAATRTYVVDRHLEPAPVGVTGELLIGGAGLARGYQGRSDLTAERFVPDPLGEAPGGRLYRTGDLVRVLPDGVVEFLGRRDDQIKIRGVRIEVAEIEAALADLPEVAEGVVGVREEKGGERRLVAYVVPRPQHAPLDPEPLRRALRERLPDVMVPALWVDLAELPRTPTGKVDRRALLRIEPPRRDEEREAASRLDPLQEVVAGLWAEVLDVERVGARESFFELGGHSLLATRVISRVRGALGVELPVAALFEEPTLAGFTARVAAARQGGELPQAPPIVPVPRDRELPLSFSQQRLWFLDQLAPGLPLYNMAGALRLSGALDVPALAAAFDGVVRRHEALRTSFPAVDGRPVQEVAAAFPVHVSMVDLTGLPDEVRGNELERLTREEARRPFALDRGPLLRAGLIRLEREEHVLALTLHHIVGDGWSMEILQRELALLYAGSPLPRLPVQYADFAVWQRQWLAGEPLEAHLAFWRRALAGAPPVLELPLDHPRPGADSTRGGLLPAAWPADLAAALRALSRREGASLAMTVMAAFQALLSRWTGDEDLVVGIPVANRNRPEIEGLIGFFVNTLPLRADLAGGPGFRSLLGRVRAASLAAYEHQDVPFERLVEELVPARTLGRTPLVQVMLGFEPLARRTPRIPGLAVAPLGPAAVDPGTSRLDLSLLVEEGEAELRGVVEYAADLFEVDTIGRLLGHLETLLRAAVAAPETPVPLLPLLTLAEQAELVAWNDTGAVYHGGDLCLHELIAAQGARTPGAVAVAWEGGAMTWSALLGRAGALAHRLRERGIAPESRVALVCERSPELMVALLAVLQAGAAYVPVDPSYPAERIAFMLEDALRGTSPVVLAQPHLIPVLPEIWRQAVLVLDVSNTENEDTAVPPKVAVDPDHPAYVIYTSGSTGRPKGAVNTHRAIVNRLLWMQETFRLGPDDRVLQKTPISFDVSVWELFWPLLAGARLVLARPGGHRDPAYLVDLIARAGITTAHFVPSLLRSFLEEPDVERCATLRRVVASGEALSADLRDRCRERLGVELWNLYGPTEAAVDVTAWSCQEEAPAGVVPIGRPITNLTIHLVDRELQPQPVGVHGELLIGGVGLARGYLGRPDLTAERFVPDPFVAAPGARVYRTGDLARRLPGGAIDFLGRLDHQVKLRGVRIEPGEIDATLRAHPAVRDAVTLVREEGGYPFLTAYVVANGVAAADLRDWLRARLPEPMVPAAMVFLEALPLNPSGKVDRRALPAPERDLPTGGGAPGTPLEEVLAGIWGEVLGLAAVGARDGFFDLGGHSLLATQVISRVRAVLGVELPVAALFEEPTPAGFARKVAAARRGALPVAPPIVPVTRDGDLPLSFSQQRLWFLDRLVPDNAFYNMAGALRLSGPLDVEALAAALSEIICRHEALRTTFPAGEGGPVQAIAPAAPVVVPRVDLGWLPGELRGGELTRLLRQEAQKPFDLARGPLLRVLLAQLAPAEHVLALTLHHIVSDGWSMGVLERELATLYGAFVAGRPSPLPELPVQYADFAVWQRRWLDGPLLDDLLAWWRERLAGAPEVLDLPLDHPRTPGRAPRGGLVAFRWPADLAVPVRALGRRAGATAAMSVLAGFAGLLSRAAGQRDVLVGSAIANRNREEIEGLIGFFVNTLVLRADLAGAPSFATVIGRLRDASLAAYDHQDLPFERLVEELEPERSLGRNPLVQVMFGFQNFPRAMPPLPGLAVAPLEEGAVDTGTSKFDLTLFVVEAGEEMQGVLQYDRELFEAATAHRLVGHLERLLRGGVAAPDVPFEDLTLLGEAERHQIVQEWNDSAASYLAAASLQELFEDQARRAPEALAAIFDEGALTYQELDRRANRLAHRLRALGVGPESRVGLCLERSLDLLVGMVGIVKAGGAYVPLDPAYPMERLALMAEDAGIRALVATESAARPLAGLVPSTVLLDAEREALARESTEAPPVVTDGESLAYVIYTSGSTGLPKGVEIRHRSIARLVLGTDYVRLGPDDRVAQAANASFDAITFEVWGPLLTGGCAVGIPREVALAPAELAARLHGLGVTALFVTTALFDRMALERPEAFAPLRHLLFGGEAVEPRRVRQVLATAPPRRLLHVYGPTESTTFATWHRVEEVAEGAATVPIGGPLANTRLHVLAPRGEHVPIGVAGELFLGGDGLARSYQARPALTAERFVPDPFSPEPGGRLYRTGDLVRRRADGAIEFLGRADHQVKVRGFRIEPGEIEALLDEHPAVRQSVVVAREDVPGDRRLVAYVVRDPFAASTDEGDEGEQVAEWGEIFDDIYRSERDAGDPSFDIIGWDSSVTGEPIPREEMREWLDDTVGRILSLEPRRVLEIGCGTGMLLFRIAPRCETYVGTDVSRRVLASLEARLAGRFPQVRLLHRGAERFDGIEPGSFDTVILNSVVQYFPGADYLAEVLEQAARAVRPGGAIFLGDLRSLPLLEAFHTEVERYVAEPGLSRERLLQRVRAGILQENELVVAPAFFAALRQRVPEIARLEVHPKRGRAHNELTAYRYQVVLRIGEEPSLPDLPWIEGRGETLESLRARLEQEPPVLAVRGLPNARLEPLAIEPQDVWDLGQELGYETELGWARHDESGRFDAVLRRLDVAAVVPLGALLPPPEAPAGLPWTAFANDPLRGRFVRRIIPELRASLAAHLPNHMLPSAIVVLDALPLNPNGKVDRRALPAPDPARPEREGGAVPPSTEVERELAEIWADLLGVGRVGVDDDFFALGGHSLLATRAVSRIRERLGVELPLRSLFERPTVGALATEIEMLLGRGEVPPAPPIVPVPRDGELPLSFAQERLWFLDRLTPEAAAYNEGGALRLTGQLDAGALRLALGGIVRRHEVLRTRFPEVKGVPVQRIAPAVSPELPLAADLSGLSQAMAEMETRRLALELMRRPFDLSAGPLLRTLLARRSEGEHALLFAVHHIAFDGWSAGVLMNELSALYAGDSLPELPVQYADFAVWQRHWLQGEVLERQLAWWRERLAGVPALELPTDHPRPAVPGFRGGWLSRRPDPSLTARLHGLARESDATLFMVLLAAFQALLHRHTGQEDFAVGSPIANRNRGETEGLIGFFVNTLVLRGRPAASVRFADLLAAARAEALGAYAHQDLPFERLVEELRVERSLRNNPLFQVMLALQNAPSGELRLAGLALAPLDIDPGVAKLDLSLSLIEADGGLAAQWEHAADLFDRVTVERFAGRFELLLKGVTDDPRRPLAELPLLEVAERHQLLAEWNDAAADLPGSAGLHELFEARAAVAPETIAAVFAGESLTYGELDARANALARHLGNLAVRPESTVVVLCERSLEMPVALLGVLKAGGTFLPVDASLPPGRIAALLDDAVPAAVLVQDTLRPLLPEGWRERAVDLKAPLPEAGSRRLPVLPGQAAYLVYTSGSTGRPKGVVVSHAALRNRLLGVAAEMGQSADDRFVQIAIAPFGFDVAVYEVLLPLVLGGRLVLPLPDEGADPARLVAVMAREEVTEITLVPSLLRLLLDEPGLAECTALRRILSGAEALAPELRDRVLARGVGRLYNMYGPSESAVDATWWTCEPGETGAVPIGRPVPNVTVRIVDRELRLVPLGVPGELLIGGAGLARGYLGRPDLTAERFVPDPFAEEPGQRAYRSGDLARLRPDGALLLLGRLDLQVKVRGVRVEPGEIEALLAAHPGVREAAVVPRGDAERGTSLVGYVVPAGGRSLHSSELRAHLAERLPESMIPTAWVMLPDLPRNANGKVDRAALPDPEPEGGAAPYAPPRTPAEELLAAIWTDLLGTGRVGADDDFFALGGHSLLATRVVARVRETFGVEIPLRALFEAPTLSALAGEIERTLQGNGAASLQRPRRLGAAEAPLSFAQQRLWFLDRWEPGSAVYNLPAPVRIAGALSIPALASALSEIARRHEALRTTFAAIGGEPRQIVHPPSPVPLPVVDLGALGASQAQAELQRLVREEAREPFDLERGPLARGRLVRLEAGDHALLWTMHHIVSDGWSMEVLLRELSRLYPALAAGRPSPLPELPIQYPDFAVWQREWLAGSVLEEQLAWWRRTLAGIAPLDLPTDRPRPPVRRQRGELVVFRLSPELLGALEALARHRGATLFMVLAAGFQALLARLARQDDVAVGVPVAGRRWREVEDLIGFFVNTLVLRTDLSVAPDAAALLAGVREATLGAYAHQDLPFETLVEHLEPRRDPSRTPIVQVMLTLQNAPSGPLALPGLALHPLTASTGTARVDLTLSLAEDDGALGGALEYDRDLFEEITARRLTERFRLVLEALANDPGMRLSDLPLLTGEERRQLLAWSGEGRRWTVASNLHEVFATRAAERPKAVAVVAGEEQLSYGDLLLRSRRLARHLARQGVRPGDRVGLFMERSENLVVAVLGVLGAGAAYVPLDPAWPAERVDFVRADSGVALLLTREWLDAERERIAAESADAFPMTVGPESLAYVIYTSGSTGRPKGVAVPHAHVARLFAATQDGFGFGADDVWTLFHSIAFDFSVWELWGALLHGGRLVVVPSWISRSPEDFHALLGREAVTVLNQTPSAFQALIRVGEGRPVEDLAALRLVIFGGEALEPATLEPWLARYGEDRPRLVNMYGITETTVHVTWRPVGRADLRGGSVIGHPLPDLSMYLADPGFALVPAGVPGEILVGGPGVAVGYLGRPEMTAERFVPDPFAAEPGARLYRSGDLARRRPDGELEFLGRIDHQVKIRGFRIEPGEIEAALAGHPAVAAAVVEARGGASDERFLAAWVVPAPGAEPRQADLRAHLTGVLPEYMIPAAWAVLPELPLTANGKVDRRALPAPDRGAGAGVVAPRTPLEEVLAGIWESLLGLDVEGGKVGAHDDFFALGGHSLLATRLAARLRDVFGIELPLRALFEAPTLGGMAARLDEALRTEGRAAGEPIGRATAPYPLSFAQQRLWFLDRLRPGNTAWSMPEAIRARGALAPAALAAALAEVVRRHETLRTRFVAGPDGQPAQWIDPPPEAAAVLSAIDLSGLSRPLAAAEASRLAAAEARRPFDLERGPLARFALARLGAEEHLLLVNTHHTVSDGWSASLLLRETVDLYESFREERPSPLPELPVQYGDYAVWQRAWLQGGVLARQLAWWRERLAGELPALDLPGDPQQGDAARRRSLWLGAARFTDLRRLARDSGATLFMVLLAAVQLLLSRLSGERDVVVGSPVAGRVRPELEGLIGLFLNNLALRTDLSGDPTGRALLARVREVALGAFTHQDLPFERLVEEIQPERDLARNPVFDVLVNLLNTPRETLAAPGITFSAEEPAEPEAKLALNLFAVEQDGGLRLDLLCDPARFSATDAGRMLEQLDLLLDGLAARPDAPVSSLSLLTPACLAVLPDPAEPLPEPLYAPVTALFAAWAEHAPDAVALTQGGSAFTYGELARAAGALARTLREREIESGDVVAVRGERSPGLIAAITAVLASGGVLLLLDPDLPEHRHRQMIELSGADRILDAPAVDPATGRLPGTADDLPLPVPEPDDAAYIFFTSGSTGFPKGVLGRHKGLSHFVAWERERFVIGPGDRCAQIAAPAVDVILRESFLALTSGATLCLPPAGEGGALGNLVAWCEAERISILHTVPTLARTWLTAAPAGAALAALRWLFLVGEPLPDALVRSWRESFPGSGVVNLYGSTETNLAKCFYVVPDPPLPGVQPAGGPMPQCQLLVLGEGDRLCAVGELGEIAVRTPFLSLGYLGRPEETAQRFAPHPWGGGERINRTGDLGRYRPDGSLQVAGRRDEQVKIRGVRIEPDEVAAVLAGHPAVSACAVLVRGAGEDRRLVACVVPREPGLRPGAIQAHAAARLPAVMVPSAVVVVDHLPLTATGKLDRRALATLIPETAAPEEDGARSASSPVEELLADLWAEVLGVERVGPEDNFFSLGGHSLLATQVVARVRAVFGVELPLRRLFEAPRLADLARSLEQELRGGAALPAPPLQSGPPGAAPLSFAQQRIWLMDRLSPGTPAYNLMNAVHLRGRLDDFALERALGEIVRRHHVLRSTFATQGGEPVQVVGPAAGLPLPVVDLRALAEARRQEELRRLALEIGRSSFDLSRGPLLRTALLRLGADEHALLFAAHHVAFDGWSRGVMVRETAALYDAFIQELPSPLPELPLQYADFSRWQRAWIASGGLDAELAWWRQRLAGMPELRLPTDHPRPAVQSARGAQKSFLLSAGLSAELAALARREGATLFMVLCAAFVLLLHRYTGQDEIVIGTDAANRNRLETEGLIGFFVNQLVLRSDLSGNPTFRKLIARSREVVLEAYAHQDLPFNRLVEALNPRRSADRMPLFQVKLGFLRTPGRDTRAGDLAMSLLEIDGGTAQYDLLLYMGEAEGQVGGVLQYSTDLFEAATIERMLERFETILRGGTAAPDTPVLALPLGEEPVARSRRTPSREAEQFNF